MLELFCDYESNEWNKSIIAYSRISVSEKQ